MKTFNLTLFAACLCASGYAQSVAWYQADGSNYYEVNGFSPNSSAQFYSSVHGGVCLGTNPVDASGKVIVKGDNKFQPQMVLNAKGSNNVVFAGEREFAVSGLHVTGSGKSAATSWGGAAANPSDISFRIFRSTDGISWQALESVAPKSGVAILPYIATDPWSGAAVLYKLIVQSTANGTRYVSKPVLLSAASAITVFPTSVQDACYIAVPAVTDGASYSILSSDGKKAGGGSLNALQTEVSLANLPSGTYLITVRAGAEQKSVKVIRL